MYEQNKTVETHIEPAERAEWAKPELRKLEAGAAEGAGGTGTDNTVFS
ncbi:MAG TPA: hypothetical protein VFZ91_08170 [Allosphingosinicella sp.]